jgi:hypothetical protein
MDLAELVFKGAHPPQREWKARKENRHESQPGQGRQGTEEESETRYQGKTKAEKG